MAIDSLPVIQDMAIIIEKLLQRAEEVKPTHAIEPPLTSLDFSGMLDLGTDPRQYAVIETACRNIFHSIIVSTPIEKAEFVQVWNLLDIMTILGDAEICDPALSLWHIEELLDTQTIEGCRTVFDYLESRRERITRKHFEKRKLIILRSCNELLRRLSRAEDTVFCGRVFIFLFQTFPLGDKSSVNLRGEYHTDNKTTYDVLPEKDEEMVDVDEKQSSDNTPSPEEKAKPKDQAVNNLLDMDTLYPIFWSLQQNFSEPTRLFEATNFESFKNGLKFTMQKFESVQKSQAGRGLPKNSEEIKGTKRKRAQEGDSANAFNPKYLTSRDLFDLEISDLAFRRHILVQALILIDFLLSLTSQSKTKSEDLNPPNKSVLYPYTLEEEDTKWAIEVKNSIASYLRNGPEGMFYYRMVDTVLSRDKNWVRWKAEHCPSMERPPFSTEKWSQALDGAKQLCANKKLRKVPMNALDVSFLDDPSVNGFEALKDPKRYQIPKVESFQMPILDDELEIDMAKNENEKAQAINAKESKTWRALRLASKDRLNLLDKVEGNAQDLKPLFEPKDENINSTDQAEQEETLTEKREADSVDGPAIKVDSPAEAAEDEKIKNSGVDQTMADDPPVIVPGNDPVQKSA